MEQGDAGDLTGQEGSRGNKEKLRRQRRDTLHENRGWGTGQRRMQRAGNVPAAINVNNLFLVPDTLRCPG